MKKGTGKIIIILAVALIFTEAMFAIGWFFGSYDDVAIFSFATTQAQDEETDDERSFSSDMYSQSLYDWAYDSMIDTESIDAKSAIVAHHLVVADEIANVFNLISSKKADTVILMSTNHFGQGVSPMQTSYGSWETYYGEVEADRKVIQNLSGALDVLTVEDETFENEHGISTLMPFVARSFPNAEIVPLVIDESLSDLQRVELAQAIEKYASNAIVIASIDMSHNLPQTGSEFHDSITMRTIASGSIDGIKLEVDSNATLDVLAGVNELRGGQNWNLTYHSNTLDMGLSKVYEENTSHILGYFTEGESTTDQFAALHAVGDIMLDRGVRTLLESHGQDYTWLNMERFLMGVDRTIGNLEGTVNEQEPSYTIDPPFRFVFNPESVEVMNEYIDIVSLANNHSSDVGSAGLQETKDRLDEMEIPWFGSYATPAPRYDETINGVDLSYIGYHQFQPDIEELQAQIEQADAEDRFVIVFPHWGSEYIVEPGSSQRELAEIMIDAGADLIIGGHPHVAQGMELIDGRLVIYSLGNFVFDQIDPVTFPALTAGVIVDNDSVEVHLLPVWTQGSQPVAMSDAEAESLFESLAEVSSEDLTDRIKSGVIHLKK